MSDIEQVQASEEKPAARAPLTLVVNPEASPLLPEIVRRYASGESLQKIAPDYGVAVRTLYRWLLSGLGDKQYTQLVTECLIDRIAEADVELENARTPWQIARARERARYARMDFERRRPQLYGQRPEVIAPAAIVVLTRME